MLKYYDPHPLLLPEPCFQLPELLISPTELQSVQFSWKNFLYHNLFEFMLHENQQYFLLVVLVNNIVEIVLRREQLYVSSSNKILRSALFKCHDRLSKAKWHVFIFVVLYIYFNGVEWLHLCWYVLYVTETDVHVVTIVSLGVENLEKRHLNITNKLCIHDVGVCTYIYN